MLKTLASPYAVGVMARIGGQVLAFVAVMVASRHLDLAAFGSYVLAWTVTVISTTLVYSGFYQALLRSTRPDHDASSYFWLMTAVAGTGALVSVGLGLAVGGPASQTGLAFVMLAPVTMLAAPVAWNEALLITAKRVRAASLYLLISEAAALAATWYALSQGMGLVGLVIGRYGAMVTSLLITTLLVRRLPGFQLNATALADSRKTVPNLWGTSALGMFSNYGGDLILGAFLSTAAVGAYRGGARITQTVSDFVLNPLLSLAWSRFPRLEKAEDHVGMGQAWEDSMRFAAVMLWPMMISLLLLREPLVAVVFDETWLPAAGAVAILALSRSVRFLTALLEPVLICTGHNRAQLMIRLTGAVVFLVALLAFGRLGVHQAALSHALASVAVAVPALRVSLRALGLPARTLPRVFLPGLLLAIGCAGLIALMTPLTSQLEKAPALGLTIAALAVFWILCVAVALKLGRVRLPQP